MEMRGIFTLKQGWIVGFHFRPALQWDEFLMEILIRSLAGKLRQKNRKFIQFPSWENSLHSNLKS
jgi:hypothetical protein